ncbi:class I SAM-dependent methyltransferase [Candidatus Lucifugimonas marina]
MCESSDLESVLDLGSTPPSDNFLTLEQLNKSETYYPLRLVCCKSCGLSQLSYVVDRETLFNPDYPYESGTSKFFRDHFEEMAASVTGKLNLAADDLAIDVGSNVGILTAAFQRNGVRSLGVEPVGRLAEKANMAGAETVHAFFDPDIGQKVRDSHGAASVITATNVFAHIDDLNAFVETIKILLKPTGVFVSESPYLLDLVQNLEYDTIYHEHLSYYSVAPMRSFFDRHGMEIIDVHPVDMHGGSLRTYVAFKGAHEVSESVGRYLANEKEQRLQDPEALKKFGAKAAAHKAELFEFLYELKREGKRIVGIGAPAKGNTFLNYCNIGPEILECLTEKAEAKVGLFAPGTHIPVLGDDFLENEQPDFGLLLSWNLKNEIMNNLSAFSAAGGKFIIPIPNIEII